MPLPGRTTSKTREGSVPGPSPIDAFNEGDLERSAAQFALECEYEFVAFGTARTQRSRAEVLEGLRSWRSTFPDGRVDAKNTCFSSREA